MSATPWDALMPKATAKPKRIWKETARPVTISLPVSTIKKLDAMSGNYRRSKLIKTLIEAEHDRPKEERAKL